MNIQLDATLCLNLFYSDFEVRGALGAYNGYPEGYDVSRCENCQLSMDQVYWQEHDAHMNEEWIASGHYCPRCGWWASYDVADRPSWAMGNCAWRGLLAKTPAVAPELAGGFDVIRAYQSQLVGMRPLDFEKYCRAVLADFLNCEVSHVGKSHDGGIDLVIVHTDDGLVPVQVKNRITDKSEGVQSIREFRGAMVLKGFSKGVFVTRASKFSSEAEHASKPDVDHLTPQTIVLVDCHRLVEIMQFNDRRKIPMALLADASAKPGIEKQAELYFGKLAATQRPLEFLEAAE